MHLRISPYILVVALAVLSGCGSLPHEDSWAPPHPLRADIPAYRPPGHPPDKDAAAGPVPEPEGTLTLAGALSAALAGSPKLASFAWSVRIAEAEQLQAGLLPNPELEAEFEEFGGTGEAAGTDAAETTIALSQLIELGHKRHKRAALAAAEQKLAGWDYETARIEVLTEVAARFIDVLVLQENVVLAKENLALARQTRAIVAKRVEAGKVPAIESTKADVAAAMSDIQLKRTQRRLLAARVALAGTWGSAAPRFDGVTGKLDDVRPVPPLERLTGLLDQGPALARWDQELAHRRAAVDLARANAVPDLTVGAGYKYLGESSDQAFVVSVGIPLPLFDRNQGHISKARFGVIKAQFDRSAAAVRARTALARAYQQLAAAHGEVIALRDIVLPGAKASFDTSSRLFEQGKTSYLAVLDAQQTLTEARGQYLDALAAYHGGVAEIEGMIGRRLSSIPAGAGPQGEKKGTDQ